MKSLTMNPGKLALSALAIVAISTSTAALGAQFHAIDTMTRPELQVMAERAQEAANLELFGNCGAVVKTKITHRREGELWRNSVKQMLWNSYTDSVSATDVPVNNARETLKAFDATIDDLLSYDFPRDVEHILEAEEHALKMKRALFAAKSEMGDSVAFTGSLEGAFSLSLRWFAIVDLDNQEMLMFGDGYCE